VSSKCATIRHGVRCPVMVALRGQHCGRCRAETAEPKTRITWRCIGRAEDGRQCFARVRGPRGRCWRHKPKSTLAQLRAEVAQIRADVVALAGAVDELRRAARR
jgi:hypothetical protein